MTETLRCISTVLAYNAQMNTVGESVQQQGPLLVPSVLSVQVICPSVKYMCEKAVSAMICLIRRVVEKYKKVPERVGSRLSTSKTKMQICVRSVLWNST